MSNETFPSLLRELDRRKLLNSQTQQMACRVDELYDIIAEFIKTRQNYRRIQELSNFKL